MAREVQSQSNRPQGKAVLGQLANAVFWLVVAIAVPVEDFVRSIPDIAVYAPFAPLLFYGLALWSLLGAMRGLQRLAAGRTSTPRIRVSGGAAPAPRGGSAPPPRAAADQRAKPAATAVIARPPTVQRMR